MTTLPRLSTREAAKALPLARRMAARSLSSSAAWLSFSSPESDFSSGAVKQLEAEWSGVLSYASPESDFQYGALHKSNVEWSDSLSFSSPEADFYKHSLPKQKKGPAWSESLSFASPEADYTARVDANSTRHEEGEWSHTISFVSPDADFTSGGMPKSPTKADTMAFTWSFAGAESDFCSSNAVEEITHQERHSSRETHLMVDKHQLPLPSTLQELSNEERAIVVTKPTAPFEIVDVNDAWVGLCGYSKEESRHRTLDKLLQGPETNTNATRLLLEELLHGHEASTVITNYTKSGRKFQNHVRVGPLRDVHNHVTHFVGVLEEVKDAADHWQQTKKHQV